MSFSKISGLAALGFASLAIAADSPQGGVVTLYPNEQCSGSGYFTTVPVQDLQHCENVYQQDPNFTKDTNGRYKIWFQAPAFTGSYEVVIQTPLQANVPGNPCGYAAQLLKSGECQLVEVDDHWYVNTCISTGEGANCPGASAKRSLNTTSPQLISPDAPVLEVVNKRVKPRGVHFSKRDDCSFTSSASGYQIMAGDIQRITEIYDNSASADSTTVELSTSTTIGSSNTFGVDTSVEAGLFDIVQTTVSFSYMYSYMESTTKMSTRSFTFPAGQAGYGAFIPYFECASGNFGGSQCNGIPTGQDGMVCVPKPLNGDTSTQDGEYRTVQT